VSFAVPKNRITGIVGESGCGKSTLINAILGLLADNGEVTSGAILLEGKQDLTRLSRARCGTCAGSGFRPCSRTRWAR
jgi:ABC-type glutathione transport system ATPase component